MKIKHLVPLILAICLAGSPLPSKGESQTVPRTPEGKIRLEVEREERVISEQENALAQAKEALRGAEVRDGLASMAINGGALLTLTSLVVGWGIFTLGAPAPGEEVIVYFYRAFTPMEHLGGIITFGGPLVGIPISMVGGVVKAVLTAPQVTKLSADLHAAERAIQEKKAFVETLKRMLQSRRDLL
jgi:hypothetical protein